MSTPKTLSDRKIIRKMSQQLGMLNRGWLEKKSSGNRSSRNTRKLKSLWSVWDEDPSVRPVICQRIKQLTYENFYDRKKTMQSLANIVLEVISSEAKILSKKIVLLHGKELLRVIHEDHSDSIDINLENVLQGILNVSETTEHQTNG